MLCTWRRLTAVAVEAIEGKVPMFQPKGWEVDSSEFTLLESLNHGNWAEHKMLRSGKISAEYQTDSGVVTAKVRISWSTGLKVAIVLRLNSQHTWYLKERENGCIPKVRKSDLILALAPCRILYISPNNSSSSFDREWKLITSDYIKLVGCNAVQKRPCLPPKLYSKQIAAQIYVLTKWTSHKCQLCRSFTLTSTNLYFADSFPSYSAVCVIDIEDLMIVATLLKARCCGRSLCYWGSAWRIHGSSFLVTNNLCRYFEYIAVR